MGESPYTPRSHEKIHYGLRGSLNMNLSQFEPSTNPTLKPEPALGWSVAGLASYRFNAHYGIKAEFGYSFARSIYSDDSTTYTNRINLHLLDLHLLASRRYALGHNTRSTELYIGLGPVISYWLGASGSLSLPGSTTEYTVVFDEPGAEANVLYVQAANRWLFGAELRVGTMVPISKTNRLLIELSGVAGLTAFTKSASSWSPIGPPLTVETNMFNQQLHTVSLSASYVFAHNLMHARLGKSSKDKTVKKRDPRKQKKDKGYLNTRIKSEKKD